MSFRLEIAVTAGDRRIALVLSSAAKLTALVGPSGAGKTTMLHCIAGLRKPEAGRIIVDGVTLFDSEQAIDLPPEERGAGLVFQDLRLFPHLTVARNLAFGERLAPVGRSRMQQDEIVALLGIAHLLDRWPTTLSGGEARRVAIGRALLGAPRFLLLDEPTASLDGQRVEALLGLIELIRDELALPMLLVSHQPAEIERLAEEVVALG